MRLYIGLMEFRIEKEENFYGIHYRDNIYTYYPLAISCSLATSILY